MLHNIIATLTTTNIIAVLLYYDQYKYNKIVKEELNDTKISLDTYLTKYNKSKKDLEELAIKMKNNDLADIDKYIDFERYSCCKTCKRCCLRCSFLPLEIMRR